MPTIITQVHIESLEPHPDGIKRGGAVVGDLRIPFESGDYGGGFFSVNSTEDAPVFSYGMHEDENEAIYQFCECLLLDIPQQIKAGVR